MLLIILLSLLYATPPVTAQEIVQFDDPQTKQRYETLLENTRCLVCQNQSLAESGAGLADDLRHEIERMLRDGKSNEEVIDFLVQRYGDFVLYNPPLKLSTLALWFAPFILLAFGATFVTVYIRGNRTDKGEINVDSEKRERAASLLNDDMENTD